LCQEDARALDILRSADAGAFQRCDDTVRPGLVPEVLYARLALQQLLQRFNRHEDEWVAGIEAG
jgi:hypothetical protein